MSEHDPFETPQAEPLRFPLPAGLRPVDEPPRDDRSQQRLRRQAQHAATARDEAPYQEIADNALEATRTRYVQISLIDPTGDLILPIAWSYAPLQLVQRARSLLNRLTAGFAPSRWVGRVDDNPHFVRIYRQGQTVVAPMVELAAPELDHRMLDVIAGVAGCRYLVVCPLYVGGQIVASIGYAMPKVPTAEKQVVCEAFSRQASMTLEKTEHARILGEQIEELSRFRTQALQAEQVRLRGGDRPPTFTLLDLHLDPGARSVTWRGSPVPLTPREYSLLQALMEQPGRALSREEIGQRVWGFVPERDSNLVDMTMVAVRRKLASSGAPPMIRAVRGFGYAIHGEGGPDST